MKIKYLIYIIVLLAGTTACSDNDEKNLIPGQREPHVMRVKKITGYNKHWKEFTLEMTYANNKLIAMNRFSKTGRQMGELSIRREQGKVYYEIRDYVPSIDADSIHRLDQKYENLYGAGNYHLDDSIPLTSTRILLLTLQTSDGVVMSQQFTYYQPTTDFGLGINFRPIYNTKSRETFVYEYGEHNQVQICRILSDVMDAEDTQNFTRNGYKMEYDIIRNEVKSCAVSQSGQYDNNWKLLRNLIYEYAGNELVSITGDGYSLQRNYNGNKLTIVENGMTTSYTLNDYGLPVKIEEADGKIMNIEYEAGDGDFEIFTRMDRKQMGFPTIL